MANGATRWLDVGDFCSFSLPMLVKILMILHFLPSFLSKHEEDISRFKTIGLIASLLVAAPTALLYEGAGSFHDDLYLYYFFVSMFFVSGLSYKIVGGIVVACVPLAVLLMSLILSAGSAGSPGLSGRIVSWRG